MPGGIASQSPEELQEILAGRIPRIHLKQSAPLCGFSGEMKATQTAGMEEAEEVPGSRHKLTHRRGWKMQKRNEQL